MTDFQSKVQGQKLSREKVFRDPVHQYIHVRDQIILDLIDTKEFQRLRRIKQLGTTSYIFHGAEHTRFNHSLGVYEITRRILSNFMRNYKSQEVGDGLWHEEENLVALCAALLHDIGHGPFSHTFEKIFATDHEALTYQIITSPQTEVNQVLVQLGEDFPEKVASVINHTYPNPQVVQLISSQIDADRMDYLLRDAYYAGVSYGNFDLTRILRVIRPVEEGIVFDFAGMHAVEDYIVSRYQMYMQVYFHPTSRGMEEVLRALLQRAKDRFTRGDFSQESPSRLLMPFWQDQWDLEDYLKLDDNVMNAYFTHWLDDSDPILKDLTYRFLSRRPFKSLIIHQGTADELRIALQQELAQEAFDWTYYLSENKSVDLPYDYYRPNDSSGRTQIELLTKNGQIAELSQVSPIVDSLAGQVKGDQRFYFPKEIIDHIQSKTADQISSQEDIIRLAYLNEQRDLGASRQQSLF